MRRRLPRILLNSVTVASPLLCTLLPSCTSPIPEPLVARAHEIRREQVCRQFDAQVALAGTAVAGGDEYAAARAMLAAEFPVRTERSLFRASEMAGFDRRLAAVRPALRRLSARRSAERVQELAESSDQIAVQEAAERSGRSGTATNFRNPLRELRMKQSTVAALHERAIHMLRCGDYARAFGICEQILVLDPGHTFDDAFWANASAPGR